MSFKHIVATTDFSPSSKHAVRAAGELAEQQSARLTLIHSYDPTPVVGPAMMPAPMWPTAAMCREIESGARSQLAAIGQAELAGVVHDSDVIARASSSMGICDYADDHDADLIVVGTHGRTGIGRLLIGSVAERVVRHAKCAVLVVRAPTEDDGDPSDKGT
jgi:universal stress protein A